MHWTRYATLAAVGLVSTIGAVDAAMSAEWDHVVLFVLVLLLVLPLSTSLDRNRRIFLVRRDLADWVTHRSATTGEPAGAVIDRAVARHREHIEPETRPVAREHGDE